MPAHITRWLSLALCLVVALTLGACGDKGGDGDGSSGSSDGAESPEALVEGIKAAAEKKDLAKLVSYVVPEERMKMTAGIVMGLQMLSGFGSMMPSGVEGAPDMGKVTKDVDALLAKYKIEKMDLKAMMSPDADQAAMEKKAADQMRNVDHVGFIREAMPILDKLGRGEKMTRGLDDFVVTDLKVSGDTATVKIKGDDVTLRKIDGRWYASMPD